MGNPLLTNVLGLSDPSCARARYSLIAMAKDGRRNPSKTPRRTYTQAERAHALELYVEHGPAEASRRSGIPSGTIRQWALREGLVKARAEGVRANVDAMRLTWAQRRGEICVRAGEVAANLLERADGSERSRDASDFMRGFAVAVDKAQLLDGAPTERVASQVERVEKVKQMRDELAARRAA